MSVVKGDCDDVVVVDVVYCDERYFRDVGDYRQVKKLGHHSCVQV